MVFLSLKGCHSRASNSEVNSPIWPEIELVQEFMNVFVTSSRTLLRIKVTPVLHLTYSKWGKPGVGIENENYNLYLNFIDKTCKIYLFIFV